MLSDDGRWLLVVNAGSDELSLFAVQPDGLQLADRVGSGGSKPTSVAISGALVYVLNNGTPNISGFHLVDGKADRARGLDEAAERRRCGSGSDLVHPGGGALIATERGTNSISSYTIDEHGYAQGPTTIKSSGQTPYGFGLTQDGSLIVSEAFGGATGAAAASSYAVSGTGELTMVSGSVGDTRSEVCWVALTNDDRFAYVTNFGDGTVSSYEIAADRSLRLHDPVAASAGRARRASATKRSPVMAATCTRSTPTRRSCSAGRWAREASSRRSASSKGCPAPLPDWPPADRNRAPALPLETSLPGVFAAGDVRWGSVKRVASAVGEGAVTIPQVHRYLETMRVASAAAGR